MVECFEYAGRQCTAHLNEPWLEFPVQHDVKAQDLEAGTASCVVGETGSVIVLEDWVGCNQGLDDHVLGRRRAVHDCSLLQLCSSHMHAQYVDQHWLVKVSLT